MNTKTKTILGIIIFLILLFGAYFVYQSFSKDYAPDVTDEQTDVSPAVNFTVTDMNGGTVELFDFIGKPIVLNFWASWCPPCKGEMPHFNDVYNEVKDDVVFIMVDLVDGNRETVETGKSFIRENGYDFPVYFDITQNAANIYRVSSIPQTVFINAEGNIEAVYAYPIPKSTLLSAIEKIK